MRAYEVVAIARRWPWPFPVVEEASFVALEAEWSIAQLVGFLDAIAVVGPAGPDPVVALRAALAMGLGRYESPVARDLSAPNEQIANLALSDRVG
jgi:hypothetical protein